MTMSIKLLKRYKEEYNQDLVGKYLGNFHIDFKMADAITETYSIESLFVGKKEKHISIV